MTAVMRRPEARRSASMMISNSIRWSLAGNEVDWMTKTSLPRTFSWISTKISMSAKRRTIALVSGVARWDAIASASAGLELPATSLIAPLLGRIAVSRREASRARGALITRRRQGWQYDRQGRTAVVPIIQLLRARAQPRGLVLPLIHDRLRPGAASAAIRACEQATFSIECATTDRRSAREQGVSTRSADRLRGERDGIDVAPVVALTVVGRAPIAEEPSRIGVGTMAEILDAQDAGSAQARCDVAGEIEQGVRRPC